MSGAPLRVLEGGARLGMWAELWERDRWRQSELPNGDLSSTHRGERAVNFGRLVQPWLMEAAKRWARARLLAGTSAGSVSSYLSDLSPLSEWLAEQRAPRRRARTRSRARRWRTTCCSFALSR
jgi:hypothetical protein